MEENKNLPEHGKGERFCNCNLCFVERIEREREKYGVAGIDQIRAAVGLPPIDLPKPVNK